VGPQHEHNQKQYVASNVAKPAAKIIGGLDSVAGCIIGASLRASPSGVTPNTTHYSAGSSRTEAWGRAPVFFTIRRR